MGMNFALNEMFDVINSEGSCPLESVSRDQLAPHKAMRASNITPRYKIRQHEFARKIQSLTGDV